MVCGRYRYHIRLFYIGDTAVDTFFLFLSDNLSTVIDCCMSMPVQADSELGYILSAAGTHNQSVTYTLANLGRNFFSLSRKLL